MKTLIFAMMLALMMLAVLAGCGGDHEDGGYVSRDDDGEQHAGPQILDEGDGEPPAAPAHPEAPHEMHVTIGEGTAWPLAGHIMLPEGASAEDPVPAVIIVGGAGALDMDGRGEAALHAPYRDIALGLRDFGIASLRYDTRTYTHGPALAAAYGMHFTAWEQAVEDALFAAQLLREIPAIDTSRVFIIGHGLGAVLAPRIQFFGGNFAGLVMLAPSPRTIGQVAIARSIEDIAQLEAAGLHDEAAQAAQTTAMLQDFYGIVEDFFAPLDAAWPLAQELGLTDTVHYLRDLAAYPFVFMFDEVFEPFVILHGKLDAQVSYDEDFYIIRQFLGPDPNATLIVYDDLDHFFMPAGSAWGAYVDPRVIEDIAEWILRR